MVGLVLVLFSDAGVSGGGGNHIYTKIDSYYYNFFFANGYFGCYNYFSLEDIYLAL